MNRTLLPILLLSTLAACGEPDTQPDPQQEDPDTSDILQSDLPRDLEPDATVEEQDAVAAGINAFAFDLYQRLSAGKEDDENLFFSPLSVSLALSMTWAGARTETESQMAEVLHFDLAQDAHHPAYNALTLDLASRGEEIEDGSGLRLNIVNSLWGQTGFAFLASFLDVLAENYGAGMFLTDFAGDTEGSRAAINAWVADQTEGLIDELLEQGIIDGSTVLVLADAISFNASWLHTFSPDFTVDGDFQRLGGDTVTVPMMSQTEILASGAGDGYLAIELPYEGEELSMLLIIPDEGRFQELEGQLGPDLLDEVIDGLTPGDVSLVLPRWHIDDKVDAVQQLEALGMVDAFSPGLADFSGMDGGLSPLYLSHVIHQATISVDEEGTEALAATAAVVSWGMGRDLVVDRPFLFMVRDIPTGAVLFLGRVADPAA